jgi:hypothetical protein
MTTPNDFPDQQNLIPNAQVSSEWDQLQDASTGLNSPAPADATEHTLLVTTQRELATSTEQADEARLRTVPTFAEQATDRMLPGKFKYIVSAEPKIDAHRREADHVIEMSEDEGVSRLGTFLQSYVTAAEGHESPEDPSLIETAKDMLENLTYIGERELDQATTEIADEWKAYLDNNPDAKLYMAARPMKSSTYILDRVLGHMGELEAYKDRLRFIDELTRYYGQDEQPPSVPDKHRVIMIDDWIGTGRQLSQVYAEDIDIAWRNAGHDEPLHTEIQLIAATDEQAQQGLTTHNMSWGVHLPIKAVYRSRKTEGGSPFITGMHSSTDDFFEIPIGNMVKSLRQNHGQIDVVMPPLTNIARPYRSMDYKGMNIDRLHNLQNSVNNASL